MSKTDTPTMAQALAKAQEMADRIVKDSTNDFSRYDYTSAESMMDMWTQIAGPLGLSLYPASLAIDGDILRGCWVVEHAASGDARDIRADWPIVTGKGKPLDKALASARTSSLGYLIRDLLVAPRVHPTDDMDHPRWSKPEQDKPAPKKAAPKKAAPAPAQKKAAPKSSQWSKPYQDALLACPGMPTPTEVEIICADVGKGAHPSELDARRIEGLLGYIESEPGQAKLSALRDRGQS